MKRKLGIWGRESLEFDEEQVIANNTRIGTPFSISLAEQSLKTEEGRWVSCNGKLVCLDGRWNWRIIRVHAMVFVNKVVPPPSMVQAFSHERT